MKLLIESLHLLSPLPADLTEGKAMMITSCLNSTNFLAASLFCNRRRLKWRQADIPAFLLTFSFMSCVSGTCAQCTMYTSLTQTHTQLYSHEKKAKKERNEEEVYIFQIFFLQKMYITYVSITWLEDIYSLNS